VNTLAMARKRILSACSKRYVKFVQLVVRRNPFLIQNFETTLKRLLQVQMAMRHATSSVQRGAYNVQLIGRLVRWSHLTLAAQALEFYDDAAALKLALLTALCFGQKMSVQVGSEYSCMHMEVPVRPCTPTRTAFGHHGQSGLRNGARLRMHCIYLRWPSVLVRCGTAFVLRCMRALHASRC